MSILILTFGSVSCVHNCIGSYVLRSMLFWETVRDLSINSVSCSVVQYDSYM